MIANTLIYLLARGIPGVISLAGIAVYTRLLSPDDFGEYAVILASGSLLCSVFFYWLYMGIIRFLPDSKHDRDSIVSTVFFSYIAIVAVTALLGGLLYALMPQSIYRDAIPSCLFLFWILGLFEMTLQIIVSSIMPATYGFASILKAVTGLLAGVYFIHKGFGANGPIFGAIAGMSFAMIFARQEWKGIAIGKIDLMRLKQLLTYGIPLTLTFALTFIVSMSDRFLLGWYLGASAVGLYAAGYDLAFQSLGMLMIIVNLAAYPVVVQALAQRGIEAAQEQLRKQLSMLLAIIIPSAAGLAICSQNIGGVFLGESFRESATTIIPWIALTTVISGIKSYYLDLSFQLGHNTVGQVYIMLISALSNVALNVILVPVMGIQGALIGSAGAYTIGFLLSLVYGRRVFPLPAPSIDLEKIVFATGIMVAGLLSVIHLQGKTALGIQLLTGFATYFCCCMLFDVMGLRKRTASFFKTA